MSKTPTQQSKLVMPFGLMYGRDITDAQKVTAMWLISYATRSALNLCWASNETLGAVAGKSPRQIRRDIRNLITQGYFTEVSAPIERQNDLKMFPSARYIRPNKKVFEVPQMLSDTMQKTEELSLKCPGGEDMDVHLYKNKNNSSKHLNTKTLALPSAAGFVSYGRKVIGFEIGVTTGFVWADNIWFEIGRPMPPHTKENEIRPEPTEAAPPAPAALCAARPTVDLHQVRMLGLSPRVEGMVMRFLAAGVAPRAIIVKGSVVTVVEDPMTDKRKIPTNCSLDELLQRSAAGQLHRQAPAKETGSVTTMRMSEALRAAAAPVKFIASHTMRELGQLKTFAKVVRQAGDDPLDVLKVVANDWAGFRNYIATQGKRPPKEVVADPGVVCYLAAECVNYARAARGAPAYQQQGPSTAAGAIGQPASAPTGVVSDQDFLAQVQAALNKTSQS